ncbi:MAG: A/G-specific adenine glycosylase [Candidatus Kapaibacterium sp.]
MIPETARRFGAEVAERILDWYSREGRLFPWRRVVGESDGRGRPLHDPYLILLSEIMLQQTQAARVVEKLPEFLDTFPNVEKLARASKADLLRAWQGMGYNSRALRLKAAAEVIVDNFNGEFPRDFKQLRSLPGIGRYTASAILCFAFGEELPVVDVNIARVLSRIFFKCYTPPQRFREDDLYDLDATLIPSEESYRWHQALMDFGAVVCTARSPSCSSCPIKDRCISATFPLGRSLFDVNSIRKEEPSFRGHPRRIWRGRIVELLRGAERGMRVVEIMESLIDSSRPLSELERRELQAILSRLREDGLVEVAGVVREGGLNELDVIQLPT